MTPSCSYCTDEAIGVDEDDVFTCGAGTCTTPVSPLPAVHEVSAEPFEELEECECGHDRVDHDEKGCEAVASSGYTCACPSFEPASR